LIIVVVMPNSKLFDSSVFSVSAISKQTKLF
jgi:hypothetical protein